jgi:CheY-like chemotaxis protein
MPGFREEFMAGSIRSRILYVEDEKDLRVPICQILELLGYEVDSAHNGQVGVEKAENWQPDLILMDIRMPVMDGIEATRVIRNNPNTAPIPIFILSAYTDAKTRDACKQAGADGFFAKPLDIEKVDMAIKDMLNRK